MKANKKKIVLKKVNVHNLKAVDLELDTNELIVFSGVSGSGKSSLAFDTLYIEGQRRYVESMSVYARKQMGDLAKPDIEYAEGISPTISIEQKTAGKNPRSTVGTMTEIYDYLRVLYARVGVPHCPVSGKPVAPQSREKIIRTVQVMPEGSKILILAPFAKRKKAQFKEDFQDLLRRGYMRVRVDGSVLNLTETIELDGNVPHDVDIVIDRIAVNAESQSRIAESLTIALKEGEGLCSVFNLTTEKEILFSMHAYSEESGISYQSLEPHDFSFNTPSGMCPSCNGLGRMMEFDLDKIIDPDLSISEDCCSIASSYSTVYYGNVYDNLARLYHFDVRTPWKNLSEKAKEVYLHGVREKYLRIHFVHPVTGAEWSDRIEWKGVLIEAHQRYAEAKSETYRSKMEKMMTLQLCPACKGHRLKPYPAATLLQDKRIGDLTAMTIDQSLTFFQNLTLTPTDKLIAEELLKEITQRFIFLKDVGLHYLTLNRTAPTLSGGEAQRVRLASQIGCGLVGITYILDEPSIGLHPRDNAHLIRTLKRLRDMGNTVIVVEHDEETLWEADRIVDIGPGPGLLGGQVVVNGDLADLLHHPESLTGGYLSGKLSIEIPKKRRKPLDECLTLKGASHHNLKNLTVSFPLGVFIAVTGVSGSGKSSLISDILHPALANALHHAEQPVGAHQKLEGIDSIDKVIAIDQSPIGRNPRSNPATYVKIFDNIRDLFCQLPESRARGYGPGRFSFNVKEGSCHHCSGMGMVKIDMDFVEDEWVICPVCRGRRFDQETLDIHYKGKNIFDILEMDISTAHTFFENIPLIKKHLHVMERVGLGYMKVGQSSTTLSGGEAQRVKLAKELVRPATGKTLYILDEPSTGLHFHDIKHLLNVLHELVDRGNTVLVIEHNMDIVKTADWVIDLGPEGGEAGGELIAKGKPEAIAKLDSPTGRALLDVLKVDRKKKIAHALAVSAENKQKKTIGEDPLLVREIVIEGAEQNNLKHVSALIPREKLTVCTGPSGSGKSSLAIDTIYAEGQRRYIESLSPYARQFLSQMPKPKIGRIEGLSPAIAIEQKTHAGNPRSTIGTMTEIYDYLRIIYSRLGTPHCPETGEIIQAISKEHVASRILSWSDGEKIQILAPIEIKRTEKLTDVLERLRRQGYLRVRLNKTLYDLDNIETILDQEKSKKIELQLVIDRLIINRSISHRLLEAIENGARIANNKILILRGEEEVPFNLSFAVESTGKSYPEITPHTFSFNTAEGMCMDCQGLGFQYGANVMEDPEFAHYSLSLFLNRFAKTKRRHPETLLLFEKIFSKWKIVPSERFTKQKSKELQTILQGSPQGEWLEVKEGFRVRWVGINNALSKAGRHAKNPLRETIIPLLETHNCISCQGARLNPLARGVRISHVSLPELCLMPIDHCLAFIDAVKIAEEEGSVLVDIKKQVVSRLKFLCEVGLHYLSLDRKAPTLSGGETQRIRLARQLGSGLTGVLYVLDEPTIGLHPRDSDRLNTALQQLKELGNTLLMVEHDPMTIQTADYILDFGPQSGVHGGHITARGTVDEIRKNPESLTGLYLSGKKTVPQPKKRRIASENVLKVKNAKKHNLRDISADFPCGLLTCLTGVSGSGKSTLMHEIILPSVVEGISMGKESVTTPFGTVCGIDRFEKVICIDQSPIGLTARSDVGTYVEVLTHMRDFFVKLPDARRRGLQKKHFSFNHRDGMCSSCWGMGYKKVHMHFLPDVEVECPDCKGMRLNPVSLEVKYEGKNFGQYLQATVDECRIAFENHPRIRRVLDTLIDVGLGYLTLGQQMATLSGGEAQRIKLSGELSKRSRGKNLYLLDEPTTGLHSDDIAKLVAVLQKLVSKGNTMIVIEHNPEMILNADYVIDLGPDAGTKGGEIVCAGTPEKIMQCKASWTGKYLSGK